MAITNYPHRFEILLLFFPNNRRQAVQRAEWLKKMSRNPKMFNDYTVFMSYLIKTGYAKKVTDTDSESGKILYIPHHNECHPKKPENICVVFEL